MEKVKIEIGKAGVHDGGDKSRTTAARLRRRALQRQSNSKRARLRSRTGRNKDGLCWA
jgi:hypothetical protein